MKLSLTFVIGLALLMATGLRAEVAPVPTAGANAGTASQPAAPRGIKVFDDRVFELSNDSSKPTTSKSPVSGSERYLGSEPNYNSAQRERAIENCAGAREKGSKEYKECFESDMSKQLETVRQRNKDVEMRQSAPERDQVPIFENSGSREPAFGGVQLERK